MAGQSRSGFAMSMVGESSSRPISQRQGGQSRPLSRTEAFGRDEDDDEDEDGFGRFNGGGRARHTNRQASDEALTGFSRAGAEKAKKSPPRQGPRVIQKQADLNWMEERKRRLGLEKYRNELGSLSSMRMPGSSGAERQQDGDTEMRSAAERIGDEEQKSGLQIRKKSREDEEMEEIRRLQENAQQSQGPPNGADGTQQPSQSLQNEMTMAEQEDEAARLALLSGHGLGSAFRSEEDKVIPISEEEALKRDTDSRPEPPSLSDYAKMPVEEFGAALLRGMGWKEGMGAGKGRQGPTSAPEVKKRAALLGLGAKERSTDNEKGGERKEKNFRVERPERRYVPVLRKEKDARSDQDSQPSSPAPPRPHRDRERERSRSPGRRREREDDRDRRGDRRYRDRSERDDEYERERERRKRREREDYRERDRERERERDRERDRDRDRHYGSDRRR